MNDFKKICEEIDQFWRPATDDRVFKIMKAARVMHEALEFYANEKCMTMPEMALPENVPMYDAPMHMINMTVSVVRSIAQEAIAKADAIARGE